MQTDYNSVRLSKQLKHMPASIHAELQVYPASGCNVIPRYVGKVNFLKD